MKVRVDAVRWVGVAVFSLWTGVACAPRQPAAGPDAAAPPWSYEGETGPAAWGDLSPDFATCESGTMQSPINLVNPRTVSLPGPVFRYTAAPLEVANLGHTLQVNYAPGSELVLDDGVYELVQYHFHTPAEHLLNGREFPMALHLVHRNAAGQLAVVGVVIQVGAENAALRPVFENLPAAEGQTYRNAATLVSAEALLPRDRTNYRYPGSLTTPPCTEGVKWIVMANPIQMSRAQIQAVNAIIHTTNRPVQPLGGREVLLDPAG